LGSADVLLSNLILILLFMWLFKFQILMNVQQELTIAPSIVLTLKAITLVPVGQDMNWKGVLAAKVNVYFGSNCFVMS